MKSTSYTSPRFLAFLAILLFLLVISIWWLVKPEERPYDAWNLIPQKPVLILESQQVWKDFQALESKPAWNLSREIPYFKQIFERFHFFNEQSAQNGQWERFFKNRKCLASLHPTSRDQYDFLFFVPIESEEDKFLYNQALVYFQESAQFKLIRRNFRAQKILEIRPLDQSEVFSFIRTDQHWVGSYSPLLIEDVVRKIEEEEKAFSFENQASLDALSEGLSKWKVYLNPPELVHFFQNILGKEWAKYAEPLKDFSSSMVLVNETQIKPEWQGNTWAIQADSSEYLNIFHQQEAPPFTLENYIPQEAALLVHQQFSDASDWSKRLEYFWKQQAQSKLDPQSLQKEYGFDLRAFYQDAKGDLAWATWENSAASSTDKVILWSSQSPVICRSWLEKANQNAQNKLGRKPFKERYDEYQLEELLIPNFPELLWGGLGQDFEQSFFTFIDGNLVISNRLSALKKYLNNIQYQRAWRHSPKHRRLLRENPEYANMRVLVDVNRVWNLFYKHCSPAWQAWLSRQEKVLRALDFISLQWQEKEGFLDTHVALHPNEQNTGSSLGLESYEVLMSHTFPRPIYSPPYLVRNHDESSEEILVQDFTNNLFLMSAEGQVRWQRKLEGPIRSDPQQIDIYRNQKLQYLFLTSHRLNLVDRLGRNVQNYPFYFYDTTRLSTLGLIDFGDNQYHYLISNSRGRVFMYNDKRQSQAGWKPKRLSYQLACPIQHLRLGTDDYLIASLENGLIEVFNRQGEAQAGFPIELNARLKNPLQITMGKGPENTFLRTLSEEGKLIRFNLAGEVLEERQLLRPSAQAKFMVCTSPALNESLYAVSDEGFIRIIQANGETLFEKKIESPSRVWEVQYFSFPSGIKIIAATDKIGSRTYLYDIRGKALGPPFPSNKKIHIQHQADKNRLVIYRTYGREVGTLALAL